MADAAVGEYGEGFVTLEISSELVVRLREGEVMLAAFARTR